jgi:hypothetical protein
MGYVIGSPRLVQAQEIDMTQQTRAAPKQCYIYPTRTGVHHVTSFTCCDQQARAACKPHAQLRSAHSDIAFCSCQHTPSIVWRRMNSTIEAVSFMSSALETLETTFYRIPGSAIVTRYFKASHRDDPGRTILEILLFLYVVRTWLQSRTRTESAGKHFIQFSEKVCVTHYDCPLLRG